jgi:hypothetical protein
VSIEQKFIGIKPIAMSEDETKILKEMIESEYIGPKQKDKIMKDNSGLCVICCVAANPLTQENSKDRCCS